MEQADRDFIVKIAKDQTDTRRRLDDAEKRIEKLEKEKGGMTNWFAPFAQQVIQNIESETSIGKFGFEVSFEGGMQMEPSYRARMSMLFVADLEQIIKKYRIQALHGKYQKAENNQTPKVI